MVGLVNLRARQGAGSALGARGRIAINGGFIPGVHFAPVVVNVDHDSSALLYTLDLTGCFDADLYPLAFSISNLGGQASNPNLSLVDASDAAVSIHATAAVAGTQTIYVKATGSNAETFVVIPISFISTATVPGSFTADMWALTDAKTGGALNIAIDALPGNGGSAITHIEFRIGTGEWVSSGGIDDFQITGLANDAAVQIYLRAVNSVGPGAASDYKEATPTAWTPLSLGAKLKGYLDAEKASSLSIVSGAVQTWVDTVAGASFTQATATARPAYNATGLNNRPCVTSDGVDDYLRAPTHPYPSGATPCEIWILANYLGADTGSGGKYFWVEGGTANTSRQIARTNVSNQNRFRGTAGNGTATVNATTPAGSITGIHVLRVIFEATQVSVQVDGGAITTAALGGTMNVVAANTTLFGDAYQTAALLGNASLNAVIVTDLLGSGADYANMLTFLKTRGGLA